MECPACSSKRVKASDLGASIYRCSKCDAVFGSCYLGDSYAIARPGMARDEVPAERLRYFDFMCLGSAGITRRHGWYDPETRLVHQVG